MNLVVTYNKIIMIYSSVLLISNLRLVALSPNWKEEALD
jgi:hypothetical protein